MVNAGTGYLPPQHTEGSAAVIVNDNDVPGAEVLLPSSLTVARRGSSSSYTISLPTRPSEPVTVSIRVPEGSGLTVDTDPGRDGNQTTLTFTADDWNVPRTGEWSPCRSRPASITPDPHRHRGPLWRGDSRHDRSGWLTLTPMRCGGGTSAGAAPSPQQVVDALQDRFAAVPTPPGLHLRVAGEELSSAVPLVENRQVLAKALGFEKVTAEQLVQDSAFSFSPVGAEAARFALWGRGALSSFSGQEDTVSLEGEVSTALVGAEWRAERWQAGAALSRSWGSGSYGGAQRGEVDSSGMTGLFPLWPLCSHPTAGHLGRRRVGLGTTLSPTRWNGWGATSRGPS